MAGIIKSVNVEGRGRLEKELQVRGVVFAVALKLGISQQPAICRAGPLHQAPGSHMSLLSHADARAGADFTREEVLQDFVGAELWGW